MFMLDHAAVSRLAAAGAYDLGRDACVLFGLRGPLPVNTADVTVGKEKPVRVVAPDHEHLRCTLGVQFPREEVLLAVPGSTVPHRKAVEAAKAAGGRGANQVLPGLLRFEKGLHPRSGATPQQQAFLQAIDFPYQRSADDLDYDQDAPVLFETPGDNIRCACRESPADPGFDSNACLVVACFANRLGKPGSRDIGYWPRFRDAAYGSGRSRFAFLLALGSEAEAAAAAPAGTLPLRLRFGSSGPEVKSVQASLVKAGLLGRADANGSYDKPTLRAVMEAQRRAGLATDGTCGLNTADALDIADWPRV